ncbi:MAG: hypothetical protein H6600_01105 [Flavobacteriales bacterium]|nr:hypothetical protein [Flavobacteriales bacterium]MCB9197035.1 hypothetical protein [Flavobacteriales bacterium]
MILAIEQIVVEQGTIIYSKYTKDSSSLDEDGHDFEYDFQAFMENLDDIQGILLRLYGEDGWVKVIRHYAEGSVENLVFDPIELDLNSDLYKKLKDINAIDKPTSIKRNETLIPKISSDQFFLLTGLIDGLPTSDDLNVMKMLGSQNPDKIGELEYEIDSALKSLNVEQIAQKKCFHFPLINKIVALTSSGIFGFLINNGQLILDFPINEIQLLNNKLMVKYLNIETAYKLKRSMILSVSVNEQAKMQSLEELRSYYLMFNVETAKFESKELKF